MEWWWCRQLIISMENEITRLAFSNRQHQRKIKSDPTIIAFWHFKLMIFAVLNEIESNILLRLISFQFTSKLCLGQIQVHANCYILFLELKMKMMTRFLLLLPTGWYYHHHNFILLKIRIFMNEIMIKSKKYFCVGGIAIRIVYMYVTYIVIIIWSHLNMQKRKMMGNST